jgi:phage shock protein A
MFFLTEGGFLEISTMPTTRHPSLTLVSLLSHGGLQEEWEQRLRGAETSASERLTEEVGKVKAELSEEVGKLKAELAAIESRRDLSAARMSDLQSQLESLQRQHAILADEYSTSGSETRTLKVHSQYFPKFQAHSLSQHQMFHLRCTAHAHLAANPESRRWVLLCNP